jgi:hypothetical protein
LLSPDFSYAVKHLGGIREARKMACTSTNAKLSVCHASSLMMAVTRWHNHISETMPDHDWDCHLIKLKTPMAGEER